MLYPNPQIYHHLRTIFVHVPKAAGTSIEKHLRQSDKDAVGGHTTALAYRRKYPEEFASYFKFAVVREPVDRFLSAYYYLRQMAIHPALCNQVVHDCESLAQFVKKVRESPAILENIIHMWPQYRFVCGKGAEVLVDSVFRFEEMEKGWAEICARAGIPHEPLKRLNPSRRLEADEGAMTETVALVKDVYARDFELFGYPMP